MINLQTAYANFNKSLFNGELPEIPVSYKGMKGSAGLFTASHSKNIVVPNTAAIFIDNRFQMSDQHIQAILIHEMIHAYFAFKGFVKENHGARFMAKLRECERKVGFEIPVTEDTTKLLLVNQHPVRVGVIAIKRKGMEKMVYAIINADRLSKELESLGYLSQRFMKNGYADHVDAYVVESAIWTNIVATLPVQRKPIDRLSYFSIPDAQKGKDAFNDLVDNGVRIFGQNALTEWVHIDRKPRI